MVEQYIPRHTEKTFFTSQVPYLYLVSDLNRLILGWMDDPSHPSCPPSGLKPHDNSLIFLHSLPVVSLLTARPPDRLEATALTWITAVSHTLRRPSPSRRTHRYTSGQTTVSAAHQQPAAHQAAAEAASNTVSTPSILPHPPPFIPVTCDMADPSLTSPSRTPLRSPNASFTLSFPFLRERSRVWEEGKEQPLPRDLPSPLPTKRNRTYSA